jgi:two-component system phosphate regulon response regulator PhoB
MKTCKVLIVEDDKDIQDVLSETFSGEGYYFTLARTGAEMRAALASDPAIDIVIIDVVLPDAFHGIRLAEEVAAQGLPLILTSGDHTRAAEMEQSGHCYILKPYRLAELLELIEATLEATKASCERKAA